MNNRIAVVRENRKEPSIGDIYVDPYTDNFYIISEDYHGYKHLINLINGHHYVSNGGGLKSSYVKDLIAACPNLKLFTGTLRITTG